MKIKICLIVCLSLSFFIHAQKGENDLEVVKSEKLKDAIKNDELETWAACPVIYGLLKS